MRIIPVLDLLGGVVVRGIAGERQAYRPIVSQLAKSAQPSEVARALMERLHGDVAYVADLDAIAGNPPAWGDYEAIANAGWKLWIDAGAATLSRAAELAAQTYCAGVVVGLESLATGDDLAAIVEQLGSHRVIFSLDLKHGAPLAKVAAWQVATPLKIALMAARQGITRMIVLDLAAVGTGSGPQTLALARELKAALSQVELIGGGGVRDHADVQRFAEAGYAAVLVASALHDGRL